jgi:hypothetical protein
VLLSPHRLSHLLGLAGRGRPFPRRGAGRCPSPTTWADLGFCRSKKKKKSQCSRWIHYFYVDSRNKYLMSIATLLALTFCAISSVQVAPIRCYPWVLSLCRCDDFCCHRRWNRTFPPIWIGGDCSLGNNAGLPKPRSSTVRSK